MDTTQQDQVFRPDRSKFWTLLVGGVFLLLLGMAFVLIAAIVALSQPGAALLVMGISGAILTLLGAWLLFVARRTQAAVVRVGDDGVTLKLQSWSLWKPTMLRAARLRWDEFQDLRLCEVDNFLMPGGIDENFILSTTQGRFVVQTTLWRGQARKIAELIAKRTGQPIHAPTGATADGASRLSPSDRLGIKLIRGFGWCCTILGCVCIALFCLALCVAKPGDRYGLGTALLSCAFVVYGARATRQFKVRMG